jgi:exodeoxyribonuclease VII small subunit
VATTKKQSVDLEKSMRELEQVVEQLESGDLSLDKSLKQFEKGVKLSRDCQAALTDAEQKVQVLMNSGLKDIAPEDLDNQ